MGSVADPCLEQVREGLCMLIYVYRCACMVPVAKGVMHCRLMAEDG